MNEESDPNLMDNCCVVNDDNMEQNIVEIHKQKMSITEMTITEAEKNLQIILLDKTKEKPDIYLPAIKTFTDKYNLMKTDVNLVSSLYCFGKGLNDVTVEYHKGLPQITVPLPSRKERCRFTLKPISNTVGDFLDMLKNEDKGIDRVVIKARDGTRIASSNTIENLLDDDFRLIINDCSYNVNTPTQERLTGEEVQRLSDVKNLISQLYEALHVREHHLTKEVELSTQLETLQQELLPLEEKKTQIELVASRRGNWLAWAGLGLMSVQFGILARLTWWEYSWDIMEPVTYFVTYGTAMAAYAYFVLTKEEYILADVKDRQHLLTLHKKSKKLGLDLNQYNLLRDQIKKIDSDLRRIKKKRDVHFPVKANGLATATEAGTITGTQTESVKTEKEQVAKKPSEENTPPK